jgi:hypothetical protein
MTTQPALASNTAAIGRYAQRFAAPQRATLVFIQFLARAFGLVFAA